MKKKEEKVEGGYFSEKSPFKAEVVSKLELDFGRGDLNLLRDKLNEVIEKLNGN